MSKEIPLNFIFDKNADPFDTGLVQGPEKHPSAINKNEIPTGIDAQNATVEINIECGIWNAEWGVKSGE